MPKGAIHVDEAPRNYQFRIDAVTDYTQSGDVADALAQSDLYVLWGAAYLTLTMGIRYRIENSFTAAGSTEEHSYDFDSPFPFGTATATFSGWSTVLRGRIEFDDLQLTVSRVDGVCSAVLTFTQMRVYFEDDDGETLILTVNDQTSAVDVFDLRLDIARCIPVVSPLPVPTTPACDDSYDTSDSFSLVVTNETTFGWRFDDGGWVEDEVLVDTTTAPPATSCTDDCEEPLPDVAESGSWDLFVEAYDPDALSKTDFGIIVCPCPPGDPGHHDWAVWEMVPDTTIAASQLDGIPKTSGIKTHRRVRHAECFISPDGISDDITITTDTEEPLTICAMERRVERTVITKYCKLFIVETSDPCVVDPFGPPPPPPDDCLEEFVDRRCDYAAYVTLTWPNPVPCEQGGGRPWHLQDRYGWLHLARIDEDGNLQYKFSNYTVPAYGWVSVVTVDDSGDCDHPCMAIDPADDKIELLWFRSDTPAIWVSYSDDEGASWTEPEELLADAYQPNIAAGPDGARLRSWFEFDSGTSGPGTIHGQYRENGDTAYSAAFTFLGEDAVTPIPCAELRYGNCQFVFDGDAAITMVLVVEGESEESEWKSTDGGETWKRVS